MNSYEERKQTRIDYYNEKAAKSVQRANELAGESRKMISAIPFGQPIQVGHYSEKADRSYRSRAHNKMTQSVKEADKAQYYADKAEAAENNNAISSDDPDAIPKLKEKLTALQEYQDEMKKANAYYRKHKTMKGYPGISDEKADETDTAIKDGYSWNQQPFPSYRLQNNNANIRRITERIKGLERKAAMYGVLCREDGGTENSGWEFDGGKVVMNAEYNRIQIFFDCKPGEEVRSELKSRGFKWAPSVGAWQRQLNDNGLYAVRRIECIQPNTLRTEG